MNSVKDVALKLVRSLPDNCTLTDIQNCFYVRSVIDRGIQEIEAGTRGILEHEDFEYLRTTVFRTSPQFPKDLKTLVMKGTPVPEFESRELLQLPVEQHRLIVMIRLDKIYLVAIVPNADALRG